MVSRDRGNDHLPGKLHTINELADVRTLRCQCRRFPGQLRFRAIRCLGYFSASLCAAMLNQEHPDLVREALPACMLLLDSLIDSYPDVVPDGSLLVSDDRRGAIYRISFQVGQQEQVLYNP